MEVAFWAETNKNEGKNTPADTLGENPTFKKMGSLFLRTNKIKTKEEEEEETNNWKLSYGLPDSAVRSVSRRRYY